MIGFGSIIRISDFHFENTGHVKPKFVVVISDEFEGYYVTVVLTSQERRWRYRALGCNASKRWYYIGGNHPKMKKPTWADLSKSYLYQTGDLMTRAMEGRARPTGRFEHELVVEVAACFAQTEDVTDFDLEAMGYTPDR